MIRVEKAERKERKAEKEREEERKRVKEEEKKREKERRKIEEANQVSIAHCVHEKHVSVAYCCSSLLKYSLEWVISKDRYKYDSIFDTLDPIDGKITNAFLLKVKWSSPSFQTMFLVKSGSYLMWTKMGCWLLTAHHYFFVIGQSIPANSTTTSTTLSVSTSSYPLSPTSSYLSKPKPQCNESSISTLSSNASGDCTKAKCQSFPTTAIFLKC